MKKQTRKPKGFSLLFEKFSTKATYVTGRPIAFILAFLLIIGWGITGPIFNYSDTWQLVINTGTTIITFLMVFLIQQSQNKDTAAIQLKLNELIATSSSASNRLVDVEDLTAEELQTIKKFYVRISELAKSESDIHNTHSIDEASTNQASKGKRSGKTTLEKG